MAELLQGCEKFVLPYLDDVAIFSENWDDHISHIDKVLERIQNARLTIKPAKCKFAQDSVKYLGHVVGLGKRSPAQLKVQTILDFPVPRTKTQVRAFLGIAGYYRQYIPMFSSLAAPLTEQLKGKSKKGYIDWTSENVKNQYILQTDASDTGIGIVLAQRNDRGEEHPILYLSKKFSDAEKVYCTTEKECAAIVYAVKKLNCYPDGQQKFIIQTDHNPLVWLKTNAGTNPRLMRWSLALQPFNFEVIHKPGRSHANADALSRID
ncbi:retrovirus-related Pol polyprotein from transposon 297 [Trichonephila inaurata madagascariensis]|uniref:Retrovirus-related Pol polyprotein from transposon 297 n=1 Tax=Trichonephila inaurata madagascariensis TaxID=2747483 RepID=A0A8X6WWN8_9ARAC|nr:retrovirus-related Pol polyprotein from transposon 297 [Trichonephila inaurata madagascariensis]